MAIWTGLWCVLLAHISCLASFIASEDPLLSILYSPEFLDEVGLRQLCIVTGDSERDLGFITSLGYNGIEVILVQHLEELRLINSSEALLVHLGGEESTEELLKACQTCSYLVKKDTDVPKSLLSFNSRIYLAEEDMSTGFINVHEVYLANNQPVSNLVQSYEASTQTTPSKPLHVWDRRKDLMNAHLMIIGSNDEVLIRLDSTTNRFIGPFVDILDHLKLKLNFNYTIILHPEGLWGSKDSKGHWNGRVAMLLADEGDMIMAGLSLNLERAQVIDYGPVIRQGYITFVIHDPYNSQFFDAASFINIFLVDLWIVYTAIGILLTLSLGIVWVLQDERRRFRPAIYEAFSIVVPAFLLLSSDPGGSQSHQSSSRILLITIWMTLYLAFQMYASGLTSLMTASNQRVKLRSFRDLYNQGYELNIFEGTTYQTLLEDSKPGSVFYDFNEHRIKAHNYFPSFNELVQGTLQNPKSAMITTDFPDPNIDPSLVNMGKLEDSIPDLIAPAFPPGSPYRDVISYHLHKMMQSGLINKIYKKWNIIPPLPSLTPSPFQCFPLDLGHITFLLAVLIGGVSSGMVIGLVERAVPALKKKKMLRILQ